MCCLHIAGVQEACLCAQEMRGMRVNMPTVE